MIRLALLFMVGWIMITVGIHANLGSTLGALIDPANMVDDSGFWK